MSTNYKNIISVLIFAWLGLNQSTLARELFENGKPPTLAQGQSVYADDVVGGYQIYGGNEIWQFEDATLSMTDGGADTIPVGQMRMTLWEDGAIAAIQSVAANLRSNNGAYWTGAPCDGDSLFKRSKGRGQFDNCVHIQAVSIAVGSDNVTFLLVQTVQSQSSGRYYAGAVGLNVAYLGFAGSPITAWSKPAVDADAAKKSALAKLIAWAERYQDAVAAQMDYKRPEDTFAAVPNLRDLKAVRAVAPQ